MDEARSARLLLVAFTEAGESHIPDFDGGSLQAAVRGGRVPARPVRFVQQVAYKLGCLGYERQVLGPLMAARRSLFGERAFGPPRFLVRVDEFPHYRAWDDPARFGTTRFERFHEILGSAGVPYLVAVLPRVSRDPLVPAEGGGAARKGDGVAQAGVAQGGDLRARAHARTGGDSRPLQQDELAMLARLARDGVSFAMHGLTHRTRFASPRRHSELCGLDRQETGALLDAGIAELAAAGISTEVFVPPYNRFDATQLGSLAERFQVVCGGPESIGQLGFQSTPQWRGETVYLPAYAPFYGRAAEVRPAVERAIEARWGLWVPIVLHWGWEAEDGWTELEELAHVLAGYAAPWSDFMRAIRCSKDGETSAAAGQRPEPGSTPESTRKSRP
jgi:hypothetical protein